MSTLGFGSDDFVSRFISAPIKKKNPVITPKDLKNEVQDIDICEDCGSDQLIRNQDGYLVCSECGMTKESVYFVNYNRMVVEDKSRNISANPIYGTMIGEKSERKGKFERLSLKNDRETQSYKIKIRKAAYFELQYIFGALKIPMTFLDEAITVFMKNWESFKKNSWLRNINGGCAAAAYLISKQRQFVIDFKLFKQVLRCDLKIFTKIILNLGLKCDFQKNTKNALVKRLIMDESKIHDLDFRVRRLACYLVDKYPLELLTTNENIAAVSSLSAAIHLINGKKKARTVELSQAYGVATSCITTRINRLFTKIVPNFVSVSKAKTEQLKLAGLKILNASGLLATPKINDVEENLASGQIQPLESTDNGLSSSAENLNEFDEIIEINKEIPSIMQIPRDNKESVSKAMDSQLDPFSGSDQLLRTKVSNPHLEHSTRNDHSANPKSFRILNGRKINTENQIFLSYYYGFSEWTHYKNSLNRNNDKRSRNTQKINHHHINNYLSLNKIHQIRSYYVNYSQNFPVGHLFCVLPKRTKFSATKKTPGWFDYGKDPPWTSAFDQTFIPFDFFSKYISF